MLKMADQRWSDIYVVFTKILCGRNFCGWYVTELKFTEELQMASLSLYSQFETNLISKCKVTELLLQLKRTKDHGKNYIKSDLPWSAIFSVIVYCDSRTVKAATWSRHDISFFYAPCLHPRANMLPHFQNPEASFQER